MRDLTVVGVAFVLVVALGAVPAAASGGLDAASGTGIGASGVDAAQEACSYPLTVTDATGTEVTVEEEPRRIVTLAPSAAQTLWALGASDKVVGVSVFADYLPNATNKETVRNFDGVRTEVVVGLEPDLVIAPDVVSEDTVDQLRASGLTVYKANVSADFADVSAKTERIGALSGECEAADATVADMRERVTAIENAVADEEKPGALYTFYGFTTGDETFIHSVITTAGLTNVAAEAGVTGFTTEPLSPEVVANNSEDIEWLILNNNPASYPSNLASSDVYNGTYAARNGQTVVLDEDYLNQPGPYTVRALENLTRAVHPEAYEEAQAALEATPTPTRTSAATATAGSMDTETAAMDTPTETATPATPFENGEGTPTPTTSSAGGPGFTAVVTVIAVLAAALVARRRR
ncbi:MAG: PGF-CTERM-anchored ABC transporter substrate-binding protein [Haloarculaceae archaeon]